MFWLSLQLLGSLCEALEPWLRSAGRAVLRAAPRSVCSSLQIHSWTWASLTKRRCLYTKGSTVALGLRCNPQRVVCVRILTRGSGGLGRRIGQQCGSFKVLILIFILEWKKRPMFGAPFLVLTCCVCFYKQQSFACWARKPPSSFPRCSSSSLLPGGGVPLGSADVVIMRPWVHLPSY